MDSPEQRQPTSPAFVVPGGDESAPMPTCDEVERIAAVTEPIVRNLQITQCYHELSHALAERLGAEANWCTFATWASKQAGQTIRQEDLHRLFMDHFEHVPNAAEAVDRAAALLQQMRTRRAAVDLHAPILQELTPQAAFDRTSDAAARGNKKVFEEIGWECARFLALCSGDTTFDASNIALFCSTLKAGEPPDGQRYLRQAFTHYYQARFEHDAKAKAELMLLANLEIGFHEQTRLQPEIADALDAPVVDPLELKRRLLQAVLPQPGLFLRLRWFLEWLLGRTTPLDQVSRQLTELAREAVHSAITESLMTLTLSEGERLRLGRDVRAEYPPTLAQIAHPELQTLLAQLDPTPNSTRGSGAEDWADLADRMHFIAELFRSYQGQPRLFRAPFTAEQVRLLKAGKRPSGPL